MLRLLITDSTGTRTVVSDRGELVVGRRDGLDVRISDAAASRNHCVLRLDGKRVQLIDLGSANGVSVGNRKVTEAMLAVGDEFRIGATLIRIDAVPGSGLALEEPGGTGAVAAAGGLGPVASGTTHDFGRELRRMIARTPWYGISLAVHVAAWLIFAQIPFSIRTEGIPARIAAIENNELAKLDTELDDYEPEMPDRLDEIIDDSLEDPDEASNPEPESGASSPDDDNAAEPHDIGLNKSMTQKISPLSVKPKIQQPGMRVDKTNLKGEHGLARKTVERGMGSGLRTVRSVKKESILVLRGDFDKMQNVLDLYKINYTLIDREDFLRRGWPKAKVLCANCARKPDRRDRSRLAARVKRFVDRGGWFISSDWSLEPYLTVGWPGHVQAVTPKKRQPDTTVSVQPSLASPLLASVFGSKTRTRWWLEETSTFFKVTRRCNVLVSSEEMHQNYGVGTVVFEFRSGRGRVLHLLGHFWQEDGNRAGLVAMHSLILNYLKERFAPGG